VEKRVRFLGAQHDVRPFLGAADLFCLPTLYDPLPNAALEALSCGLPVVTTTTCGAAEFIEPGVNGALCPPLEPVPLAVRLDALCAPGVAAAMASAAHRAVSQCDRAAATRKLVALYEELAGAPS